MTELHELIVKIVHALRIGEVTYAYQLYPAFINSLSAQLTNEQLCQLSDLLQEMLLAQEHNNTVWLADILEYKLLLAINDDIQ